MRRNILTPGAKKRFLSKLKELVDLAEADHDRETIMWYAAQIMPTVVSELNYYPEPQKPARNRRKS